MNDQIKTTDELLEIVSDLIGKGGMDRVAHCSVSEVVYRKDAQPKHRKDIVYKLHLYYGPFCNWKERTKCKIKNPSYLCKRDVVQFVAKALSNKKSQYYFNQKTGKWDYQAMVM